MAAASQVFFAIKLSMSRSVWEVVDVLSVAIDVSMPKADSTELTELQEGLEKVSGF